MGGQAEPEGRPLAHHAVQTAAPRRPGPLLAGDGELRANRLAMR